MLQFLQLEKYHAFLSSSSGNGDGFYSSAFQSQLEGNSLYNASMPRGEYIQSSKVLVIKIM
jgi:dolichyl-phosphate-mannose-protein mannosyltransferase